MDLQSYISNDLLVLLPVLLVIGSILKGTQKIKDKYIPVILLPFGIVLAMLMGGFNVNGLVQGVLITGTSVYCNQLYVQSSK